jgi:hypothetical protein
MNTPHNDTNVDFNAMADFIYCELGLDPIPVDSKNRKRAYSGWEGSNHKAYSEEQFKALKASGAYNKGIGAAMGPVLRNGSIGKIGMYANCIDGDNALAVQELFASYKNSPKEFAK